MATHTVRLFAYRALKPRKLQTSETGGFHGLVAQWKHGLVVNHETFRGGDTSEG